MKQILPLLLILLLILTGCSAKNADSPAADAPTDTPFPRALRENRPPQD